MPNFSGTGRVHEFYRLKAFITLEQVITSVVEKKNNNNLDDHNFVGEANWSGVLSFHFVNYATLTQTVYVLIFSPLHYTTHLRWTCQSSVINMILFFLRFWINMLLYVKESSLLGLVPLGTVKKSRSRKWSVVGLKGDGVVPDSLPTINLIPTNALL